MNKLCEALLSKTKTAVRLRESGDIKKSGKLFAEISANLKTLKSSSDSQDQDAYIQIIGEIVIQYRHEGKNSYLQALNLARSVYQYAKQKVRKNPVAVRAVSNTLMDLESYELAEKYLREMLSLIPSEETAKLGDTQAHLAKCLYRTSKIDEAEKQIEQALFKIDMNNGSSSKMHIVVWKSYALCVKALILNSKGQIKEAIKEAEQAHQLAKKEHLAMRIEEAKQILEYLRSE